MSSVSVMTWNVRYFGHNSRGLATDPQWMRRMAWVLAGLPDLPQVIALQEVEDVSLRGGDEPHLERFLAMFHDALAHHRSDARYEGLYFPAHRYQFGKTSLYTTGLALLVDERTPILSHNAQSPHDITCVRLSRFARLKQRRIVAHAELLLPCGRSLDVYNTHLSLPAFFEVGPVLPAHMGEGSNQVREAKALIEAVGPLVGRAVVVMGDLNSAPGSATYGAIAASGLRDLHGATLGADAHRAHRSASFLRYRMHIDHIFASSDLGCEAFVAHDIDEPPFMGLSDHAPKRARLSIGPR